MSDESFRSSRSVSNPITSSGLDRRNFLRAAGITVAAAAPSARAAAGRRRTTAVAQATPPAPPTGPYKLPPLGYAFDALEPYIDARTMEIHHDKHHQAYVNNLNIAVAGTELRQSAGRTVDRQSRPGAGENSHRRPEQRRRPRQPQLVLATAEERRRRAGRRTRQGDRLATRRLRQVQGRLLQGRASTRFGSGWAWLIVDENKKLVIESSANQDSPLMVGKTPILGIDVWEHAYYLKYQNRRPEYIEAFFSVINWPKVDELYAKAMAS